jgi:hypothetical protein
VIFTVTIPMRLESVANTREHWQERRRRDKQQAQSVLAHLLRVIRDRQMRCSDVAFCRIGPQVLDSDNLQSAFKGVRDTVATFFGVSDSPSGPITWHYEQRRGTYAIEIRMEVT